VPLCLSKGSSPPFSRIFEEGAAFCVFRVVQGAVILPFFFYDLRIIFFPPPFFFKLGSTPFPCFFPWKKNRFPSLPPLVSHNGAPPPSPREGRPHLFSPFKKEDSFVDLDQSEVEREPPLRLGSEFPRKLIREPFFPWYRCGPFFFLIRRLEANLFSFCFFLLVFGGTFFLTFHSAPLFSFLCVICWYLFP